MLQFLSKNVFYLLLEKKLIRTVLVVFNVGIYKFCR